MVHLLARIGTVLLARIGMVYYTAYTWCSGTIDIPDIDSFNWNSINFDDMNKPEILSYSHLVRRITMSYEDTEADDLNA